MASSSGFINQLLLIMAPSPGEPDDHWTLEDIMFSKSVFEKFPKQCPRLMFIGLENKTEAQVMKRYNELVADHRKKAIEERRESSEVVNHIDTSSKKKRNSEWRWTEDEHRRFLEGLEKIGKGNWREISRYYVLTKSPQQVASHAQKYYLRLDQKTNKNNNTTTRMRRSIHDIITRPPEDQYVLSVSEHANYNVRPAEDHVNSTDQLMQQQQQQQQLPVSEEEVNNQVADLQQAAVEMQIGSDENPIVLYRGRPGLEGYYNFEDLL